MGKTWYSVAVSTLLLGCGGNTEAPGNSNNGNTGGNGSIDGGAPAATGGMMIAYYGPRVTGGNSATGGTTSNCPATEPTVGSACSGSMSCNYFRSYDCAYPCSPGCTLDPTSAVVSGYGAHSVCSNGVWVLRADGACPTVANCQCSDAGTPDRNAQLTASCKASGGAVITSECCTSTSDFPRTCNATGACGCGPGYTKPTLHCSCPGGCFDGAGCVQ